MIEYVDHLHEHFIDPAVVSRGRYRTPLRPGFSAQLLDSSLRQFRYPDRPAWSQVQALAEA